MCSFYIVYDAEEGRRKDDKLQFMYDRQKRRKGIGTVSKKSGTVYG